MKIYAIIVTILCFLMFLLYAAITLFYYHLEDNPPVGDLKDFTYELAKSDYVKLVISEDKWYIFRNMTEEEFNAEKSYYYTLALSEQKANLPKMILQSCLFIFIYVLGFVIHVMIWRNIR